MHTRNPSVHASAWKARALSALRSNSSLSVRLARYNAAMSRARALEAQEVSHLQIAALPSALPRITLTWSAPAPVKRSMAEVEK